MPFEAQALPWRVQTLHLIGTLLTAWPHRFLDSCRRVSFPVVSVLRRMQGLPSVMWVPLAQAALAHDPPALTRWLLATGQTVPGRGEDPSAWAAAYLTACRRLGMSIQRIRSRSQFLPPPLYSALDDRLFDERVERAVTRALERAKARWWRGLS